MVWSHPHSCRAADQPAPLAVSVVQPSGRASPALLVSSGGGNKMVRPSLDLPGALGRVGLLSSPRKGGGGSVWFQGGPLLVTIDKLTSRCFIRASSGVCCADPQPGVLSPHSVFLPQFLLLSAFIHFTFWEVCGALRLSLLLAWGMQRWAVVAGVHLNTHSPGQESSRPSADGPTASLEPGWLPSPGACGLSLPARSASFRRQVDCHP